MLKSKNESTLFFSSYLVAKSESWSQAFLSPVFGLQEVSKYFVNAWTHALLKILARFIRYVNTQASLKIYSLTLFKNIFPANLDCCFIERITKTKQTSAELWYNNILLKRKHHLHDCNSDNYSTSGCIWIRSPSFSKSSNNINKSPVVLHSSLGTASLLLFLFLLINLCKR